MLPEKPESEPNDSPQGTEQATQPDSDMVDIHEASIADLDAALANAQAAEAPALDASPDEGAPVADDATPNANEQLPAGQSAPTAKAVSDGVAVPGADPSKPAQGARTYTQDEIQGILAENERRKNEGNQKELFIQHRGNELGQLKQQLNTARQQLSSTKTQLMAVLEEQKSSDPFEGVKTQKQIDAIDSELEGLNAQEDRAAKIVQAQTFFVRHVDTNKVTPDDIAETLKADGIEQQYIDAFKANPWEWTTPEALVQLGKRAMDRKEFTQADSDRRILAKHILTLNNEIAKLKGKPAQVVNQLQKHLNAPQNVNAASPASPKAANTLDPSRVPQMSDAELNSALQNAQRH